MTERDKMIELAYDAIEDPQRWKAFLGAFREAINGDHAILTIFYPERGEMDVTCMHGVTQEDMIEYKQKWQYKDPWHSSENSAKTPLGQIVPSQLLCPDEELEQLDVYKEFLSPRNWHYGGAVILTSSHHQCSILSTARAKTKGPLGEQELSIWRSLVPHLQRAVRLTGELGALRTEREALIAYVDELPTPLFLVNQRGSIYHANDAADRFLHSNADLSREGSRLKWVSERAQAQFIEALDSIGRPSEYAISGSERLRFEREGGQSPLLVLVNSIGAAEPRVGSEQPTAAVYVIDPGATRPVNENDLRELYGLTRSEAAIAALLTQGCSAEEAAERTGVTMNTIRTHLKRTLEKTGCRRQAELVALVLRTSTS